MIVVSFISIAYVCQVKNFQSFSYRFSILHEITLWEGFRPLPPPPTPSSPPPPTPSSPNHGPIAEIFTRCSITLENHRAIQIR